MSIAKRLFRAVDYFFDRPQNGRRKSFYKDVDFVVCKDISYHDDPICKLDTYCVKKYEGKYPVMFYIHGGGFVAGDKHHRRALSEWLAVQGYFVVNVNYGLCPECKFPAPLQHLIYALNWLENNADRYNLDLGKIVIAGDSAGAYYSTAVISVVNSKALQERLGVKTDITLKGAWLNCGLYDLRSALGGKVPLNLGAVILDDFASVDVKDINEYEYLDLCSIVDLADEKFPKTFVTYAQKDIFCKGQSEMLMAKLKECGVEVDEYHSTKLTKNHCFSLNWTGKDAITNNSLVEKFLADIARNN